MTRSRRGPYFRLTLIRSCFGSLMTSKPLINPSCSRIRTTSVLILLPEISRESWYALLAFRMRVRRSAIGSVVYAIVCLLPARLGHAGKKSPVRLLSEADSTDSVLAEYGPRAPAD